MIIKELGHENRLIDVFKIDIEGSEFKFFSSVFQSSEASYPRQLLVEIHPKTTPDTHECIPWIFYRHHFGVALIQLPIFYLFSFFFRLCILYESNHIIRMGYS
jgi:hypothetical protein